MKQRRGNK